MLLYVYIGSITDVRFGFQADPETDTDVDGEVHVKDFNEQIMNGRRAGLTKVGRWQAGEGRVWLVTELRQLVVVVVNGWTETVEQES